MRMKFKSSRTYLCIRNTFTAPDDIKEESLDIDLKDGEIPQNVTKKDAAASFMDIPLEEEIEGEERSTLSATGA